MSVIDFCLFEQEDNVSCDTCIFRDDCYDESYYSLYDEFDDFEYFE